jgi:regulator of nonsense transcripts 2
VTALLKLPRSRSDLTSTYARIVASLCPIFPEIAVNLLDALRREFYGQQKSKGGSNLDSRMKNVRYHGELIKFRVCPPIVAFRFFQSLLMDLSPMNVEVLAVLLESCGRFLYLLPYTRERMQVRCDFG